MIGSTERFRRAGPVWRWSLCALVVGCASPVPPVPGGLGDEARRSAESLRQTVVTVVDGGGNLGRFRAIRTRARELGLADSARPEWIDWFTLQRNLVIEIPGSTSELIYVVAHYDKTDANPFKLASLLVNGLIDELVGFTYLTDGAIDNATGVAVALEVAAWLRTRDSRFTHRILLAGAEESGLRGSRAHLARIDGRTRASIRLAINVDTVGVRGLESCVSEGVSDPALVELAEEGSARAGVPLHRDSIPAGASSDFEPFRRNGFWWDLARGLQFNLLAGLLPQRSWFTGSHRAPVVSFSACSPLDWGDRLASIVLLPTGRLHGPRDRGAAVDPVRLREQYVVVRELLSLLDERL